MFPTYTHGHERRVVILWPFSIPNARGIHGFNLVGGIKRKDFEMTGE